MKKKIFITGGNGFLGNKLKNFLKQKNFFIYSPNSKELNLCNYNELRKVKNNFDYVYHLAAWTQAGDFCLKYPSDQWVINQLINTNIIKWWTETCNLKSHLTIIGSSCCYNDKGKFKEENYMFDKPHRSLQTYALTKKMLLQGAISAQLQKKLSWNCYVPSTLYGTGYKINNKIPHFIFDLIVKIIRAKKFNKKVILWGNGFQKREIVHVDDFIQNIFRLNKKVKNNIINIGAGESHSIRYFAKIICKYLDYDFKKIFFDEKKYVGSLKKKLSIKKVSIIDTNYKSKLKPIVSGIEEVVDWHLNNNEF